ncbi:MAG: hypothetical protein R2939_18165 [Kofleriaceae bacterium]
MQVPQWLTVAVAVLVIVFGLHRLRVSMRPDDEEERARARGGLYGQRRRTHRIIGVLYLLLGAGLIATTLGFRPLAGLLSRAAPVRTPAPAAPLAPPAGSPPGTTVIEIAP